MILLSFLFSPSSPSFSVSTLYIATLLGPKSCCLFLWFVIHPLQPIYHTSKHSKRQNPTLFINIEEVTFIFVIQVIFHKLCCFTPSHLQKFDVG
ncbi:hypothetical protein Mapa_000340 [Marchantia paleacea]|nr:hypothetical protein Mapa_000340 [Marchantia paleacea]